MAIRRDSKRSFRSADDERYLSLLVQALSVCRDYRPKFGKGRGTGLSRQEFQSLYSADPFCSWFGFDSPLLYTAHKAAGGMTSIYRQIGIGCERLFRTVVVDSLAISSDDAQWSYAVPGGRGKSRTLSLDARIPIERIPDRNLADRARDWLAEAATTVHIRKKSADALEGVVFEVRQAYKRVKMPNGRTPTRPMPTQTATSRSSPCCHRRSTTTLPSDLDPSGLISIGSLPFGQAIPFASSKYGRTRLSF